MHLYLLGREIQHSRSPGMWNGVFERLGLGLRYGLLDIGEDGLPAALDRLRDPDVVGYNVTMPYKGWAYDHAEVRSRDAERVRGGNWLHIDHGRVGIENTDVEGARALLDAIPASDRVLLLGAGGTAAALLTALEGRAERVVVSNRTPGRADELVERASAWLGARALAALPWDQRMAEARHASLVVNTTAIGMRDECSPLDEMAPRDGLRIYDLVYRAAEPTPLQRQAARWGVPFADGLAHLEAQAVALLPLLGLTGHAELVRRSLTATAGRAPRHWD